MVAVSVPWGSSGVGVELNTFTFPRSIYADGRIQTSTFSQFTKREEKTRKHLSSNSPVNGWRNPSRYEASIEAFKIEQLGRYTDSYVANYITSRNYSGTLFAVGTGTNSMRAIGPSNPGFLKVRDNLITASETGALAKLNNEQAQLGLVFLESRKTISHLARTFTRVLTLARNLKKGNLKAVSDDLGLNLSRRGTRRLASNWLEYRYAWQPLLGDVYDAYGLAQEGINKRLLVKAIRRSSGSYPTDIPYWRSVTRNANELYGVLTSNSVDVSVGYQTVIHAEVNSVQLAQLKALGLANPALLAWEIVPFSFVLDWIVPVGTFLEALSGPLGLTFVGGSRTMRIHCKHSMDEHPNGTQTHRTRDTGWYQKLRWSGEILRVVRTPLSDFPVPGLYSTSRLSTKNAVTAVALWRATRRR